MFFERHPLLYNFHILDAEFFKVLEEKEICLPIVDRCHFLFLMSGKPGICKYEECLDLEVQPHCGITLFVVVGPVVLAEFVEDSWNEIVFIDCFQL